ncbi:MAG: hypothetical protein PUB52_10090 [Lachnospiraceae bacterium]|nr:hypothetical protein [Lachnospiraceae bacterium]
MRGRKAVKNSQFEHLNPENNIDLGVYETILDEAMDDEEVCNIALAGGYGAGKSSIICSYEELHRDKKFIHVSLTHFASNKEMDNNITSREIERFQNGGGLKKGVGNSNDSEQLVGRIINQLVHQMRMCDIPQTRFMIKELVTTRSIVSYTTAVLGIMLPLLYWTNYSKIGFLAICLNNSFLKFWCGNLGLILMGIIFGISLVFLVYRIIRRQFLHPFITQFNFKDSSIPMNQMESDKNFDKYLDEIIYLFQKSNVFGVVFDDLDRFDDNGIFVKLREMNYLINKRRNPYYSDKWLKRKKRKNEKKWEKARADGKEGSFEPKKVSNKVKFLYLLRDDMFESEDRTKFFDLIIPVIPIVDGSNSYDKFIEIFEQHNLVLEKADKSFLKKISVYVDDMRIVKNIFNEFLVYTSKLTEKYEIGLEKRNMLGYICYKNLFPKDFLALQHGEGFLWTVIGGRERIVDYRVQAYQEEKSQIETELEQLKSQIAQERCKREEQLLVELFPADDYVVDGKAANSFPNFVELVSMALKGERVEVGRVVSGGIYGKRWELERINVADIVEDIKASDEYQHRIALIGPDSQTIRHIQELQEKITGLDMKIASAVNASAEELYGEKEVFYAFTSDEMTKYRSYIENPKIDLVSFLVKEGIINEGYHDYITYFYGVSQSVVDKNFVLNFNARRENDCEVSLDNPEEILRNYSVEECRRVSAMNYSFLGKALEVDVEKASAILQYVRDNGEYIFLKNAFVKCGNDLLMATMVEVLLKIWPDIIMECRDSMLALQLLSDIAKYGKGDNRGFNVNHIISHKVKNCIAQIGLQNADAQERNNIIRNLQSWETEFVDFSDELNDEIRIMVLEAGLFIMNRYMIGEFLRLIRGAKLQQGTFLTQCMAIEDVLSAKIVENPDDFFKLALDGQTVMEDEESIILEFYDRLGENYRAAVLDKWVGKIRDIRVVAQDKWSVFYQAGVVTCSIDNILCYFQFCGEKIDDVLVDFLNGNIRGDINLGVNATDESLRDLRGAFFGELVIQSQLNNDVYRWLAAGLNRCYVKGFATEGIDSDKLDILIDVDAIHMTRDCLAGLRSIYPDHVSHFIAHDVAEYEKIVASSEAGKFEDEIREVIESGELKEKEIRKLLPHYDGAIRLDKKWSNSLRYEIVKNHLDDEDYKLLVRDYGVQKGNAKKDSSKKDRSRKYNIEDVIMDNLKLYAADIATYDFKISDEILKSLFSNRNIPEDVRKAVYIGQVPYMNPEKMQEYLKLLVETDCEAWLKIIGGKQARVEATEFNKEILARLQRKRMISSFKYDQTMDMYCVYMPRKRDKK